MNHQVITFLFILVSCWSCRPEPNNITKINKEDFTLEEQQEIGNILQQAIDDNHEKFPRLSQTGFAEAYSYLDLLMQTLLASPNVKNRNEYSWDITIIRNDDIKTAFITPGGHLYLYTGFLKFLETEHQLAAVISHEIAYADSDFIINRLKAEYGGIILGDLLLGNDVNNLDDIACSLLNLAFAEPEVLNADTYSVDLLCPFAYDAAGIKSFLETVDSSDIAIEWLETRGGNLTERIQNINTHAAPCGTEGQVFRERYQNFKETLLP